MGAELSSVGVVIKEHHAPRLLAEAPGGGVKRHSLLPLAEIEVGVEVFPVALRLGRFRVHELVCQWLERKLGLTYSGGDIDLGGVEEKVGSATKTVSPAVEGGQRQAVLVGRPAADDEDKLIRGGGGGALAVNLKGSFAVRASYCLSQHPFGEPVNLVNRGEAVGGKFNENGLSLSDGEFHRLRIRRFGEGNEL
jgi:hypothetical protein